MTYKIKKKNLSALLRVKSKGFTLLEILIASAIFATVLVIATVAVGSSSGYYNKLNQMRKTSEETRKLSDMISRDVRGVTVKSDIEAWNSSSYPERTYNHGIALLNYVGNNQYQFTNYDATPSASIGSGVNVSAGTFTPNANVLIISTKTSYKIYVAGVSGTACPVNTVCYKEILKSDPLLIGLTHLPHSIVQSTNTVITSDRLETNINFGGFVPNSAVLPADYQQAYVRLFITSKTKPSDSSLTYSDLQNNKRALSQIRTIFTARSYGQ